MEICELQIAIPSMNGNLALHRLETKHSIRSDKLSFETRPPRLMKVADLIADETHSLAWRRNFTCSLEEVLTFELTCSSGSCDYQWLQYPGNNGPACEYLSELIWRVTHDSF